MKIGVCTLMIGKEYSKYVEFCRKTLVKYCEKHGYDLLEANDLYDKNRDPMWSKIRVLQKFLPDYDYVVWIDADVMIMNDEFKLKYFILGWMNRKDMMLAKDAGDQINTGVWFIKNSIFTRRLLSLIYNLDCISGNYHEQGVLTELYNRDCLKLKEMTTVIEERCQRLFNPTMYSYHIGDFCIHYMGIRKENLYKVGYDHYPFEHDGEIPPMKEYRNIWFNTRYKHPNERYIIPKSNLKICVCTLASGEKYAPDVIKYGKKSMELYCDRHGYNFVFEDKILDPKIPPHWSKLLLLLRIMKENYDYVVWLDADIMIMNHDIKIEELIVDHLEDKELLISRDISEHINTGVWIVRNTEYMREFINLTYNLPELRYRGYEDQDTFNSLYEKNAMDIQKNSVVLPAHMQHILNCCVGLYKHDVFLVHFYSLSREGLIQAFNSFYPFMKEDETVTSYNHRIEWIKKR